ncbi:MAG: ABC transporter substrate-binding protein [Euryarchaeota archaeon]|nr:ABC transporter substrate-binding protein [Euryarchaeota archaeon]
MREPNVFAKNLGTYGYIIDREDEAEEFIAWHEGYRNTFKTRTEGLTDDEKPRVYLARANKIYRAVASGSRIGQALVLAGGYNIVDQIVGPDHPKYGTITIDLDPEWVVEQNPDYIFVYEYHPGIFNGYETDDPSGVVAAIEEIMNRPELANINAVKNERVYFMSAYLLGGGGNTIMGTAYMGKMLQPELFTDINPQEIHQEFVDKFCHIDFDLEEHGVFVYPNLEES